MRIGQLAAGTGVSVETLRYYEREGILRKPGRTSSGYRVYSASDVEHVRFVRQCQNLGFSLQDIRQLAGLHGLAAAPVESGPRREQFTRVARARLDELDAKIAVLLNMRQQVGRLLTAAEVQPEGCPAAIAQCPAVPASTGVRRRGAPPNRSAAKNRLTL